MSEEMVNSPAHYRGINLYKKDGTLVGSFEAIEYIDSFLEHLNLSPAASGSMKDVFKYILRSGKKNIVENQGVEDLEKAEWYLHHVIEILKRETAEKTEKEKCIICFDNTVIPFSSNIDLKEKDSIDYLAEMIAEKYPNFDRKIIIENLEKGSFDMRTWDFRWD